MSNQKYSPEFKDEAVRQIVDHGYPVAEVWNASAFQRIVFTNG